MTFRISAADLSSNYRQSVRRTFEHDTQPSARLKRANYRVDQGYRHYTKVASDSRSPQETERRPHPVPSADLLDSMIQQMGGARLPSAKGTFVDISV